MSAATPFIHFIIVKLWLGVLHFRALYIFFSWKITGTNQFERLLQINVTSIELMNLLQLSAPLW